MKRPPTPSHFSPKCSEPRKPKFCWNKTLKPLIMLRNDSKNRIIKLTYRKKQWQTNKLVNQLTFMGVENQFWESQSNSNNSSCPWKAVWKTQRILWCPSDSYQQLGLGTIFKLFSLRPKPMSGQESSMISLIAHSLHESWTLNQKKFHLGHNIETLTDLKNTQLFCNLMKFFLFLSV